MEAASTSVMHRDDDPGQVMAALCSDLLAKDKQFFPGKAEQFTSCLSGFSGMRSHSAQQKEHSTNEMLFPGAKFSSSPFIKCAHQTKKETGE